MKNEQQTLTQIKADYEYAIKQVKARIKQLTEEYEQNPTLKSKIYQRRHQEQLQEQMANILRGLSSNNLKNTQDYLKLSYQDAYIGSNYNVTKEGYNLFLPYDDKKVVQAIYHSPSGFKISAASFDGNIEELRKKLQSTLSRGLVSGMDYHSIAVQATTNLHMDYNRMKRIIATEGHRVQNEAKMDCMRDARAVGADIVKEWCAVMDNKTRTRHSILDGQVRELDEPFTALGADVMYPGGFGIASEDIHCRCCLLQRSRRVLPVDKRKQLESYAEFRQRYKRKNDSVRDILFRTAPEAKNVTEERLKTINVIANSPKKVQKSLKNTIIEVGNIGASGYDYENNIMYIAQGATEEEIIHEIGHAVDNLLIDNDKRDIILMKSMEGLSIEDVQTEVYYKNNGDSVNIFVLKSDSFVSEYQSRLYVNDISEVKGEKGLRYDVMYEFISEGYREYIMNPHHLKETNIELYELIKEAVNDY